MPKGFESTPAPGSSSSPNVAVQPPPEGKLMFPNFPAEYSVNQVQLRKESWMIFLRPLPGVGTVYSAIAQVAVAFLLAKTPILFP